VALYLHRGAFEPLLADEDDEHDESNARRPLWDETEHALPPRLSNGI